MSTDGSRSGGADGLLTLGETAARLGLSRSSVYRKVRSGELPAVRLGRRGTSLRVRPEALERWISEHALAASHEEGTDR